MTARVVTLALAYDTKAQENPYYRQAVIREWVQAGIRFAADSSHRDGSCDDYYPYEHASGAAAFSLRRLLLLFRMNPF